MPRTMKRPVGAPTTIDDIVAYTSDGIPVTCGERIISAVRSGSYVEVACGYAGIERVTLLGWITAASEASRKKAAGHRLTANETRYLRFASALYVAENEAEATEIERIYDMGKNGRQLTTVTTLKDDAGKITGTQETVREIPPSDRAATWHAERRWSHRWNRRQQIEVSGVGDDRPSRVESPLADLMQTLDAMDRRTRAIETTSSDTTEGE